MHKIITLLLLTAGAATYAWIHNRNIRPEKPANSLHSKSTAKAITLERLKRNAAALQLYATDHGYNTRYCFLVDMKLPCGSKRFFVYDYKKDSVLLEGLVTHGYGNSSGSNVSFSNIPGSNSSSVGRYKIGDAYQGKFGLAYKLYGLDSTNSNAFKRFVVLHSHECVPDAEVSPEYICMSQGCPTVSPAFLHKLGNYLNDADKPVLLKIFY